MEAIWSHSSFLQLAWTQLICSLVQQNIRHTNELASRSSKSKKTDDQFKQNQQADDPLKQPTKLYSGSSISHFTS